MTGYYKTPRGKHRQNTLSYKSQQCGFFLDLSPRVVETKAEIN